MAFKKLSLGSDAPDSPDQLFRELTRRKFPDVLPHQKKVMELYSGEFAGKDNVAIQLPTGSGKTLVGALIAEWRRRKFDEKVVYLCPTKQLVNQTVDQCNNQYGLSVAGFTGSKSSYTPDAKAAYASGSQIAVTTYSSLFNVNPYFADPDCIVIDDSHSCENYISAMWSVFVSSFDENHKSLHAQIANVLKPVLNGSNFNRLKGIVSTLADQGWVDKLPTPTFQNLAPALAAVFDQYGQLDDIRFKWSLIKDHLDSCHLYMNPGGILIRPIIPPTWTHTPFFDAGQRIFMSATLGAGGDLERLSGCKKIHRIPAPSGFEKQGVGRRLFMFPSFSLDMLDTEALRHRLLDKAGRGIILAPDNRTADAFKDQIANALPNASIFSADQIENSKKHFVKSKKAVAIVANRYDGIDFPSNECRFLCVDSLPRGSNLQERFFMSRMSATVLLNDRIQTRVLQALGRCTRSLEDFSAVFITGPELGDYLANKKIRKYLHPELQSEIAFGIAQSRDVTKDDFLENMDIFLENGEDWDAANADIINQARSLDKSEFPASEDLTNAVSHELDYMKAMWNSDFSSACEHAETVLSKIQARELKGYRCLWHYLAGSAAILHADNSDPSYLVRSKKHYTDATKFAGSLPWLVSLANFANDNAIKEDVDLDCAKQVENVEENLISIGVTNKNEFAKIEKSILEGLASDKAKIFEKAHEELGNLLGYKSQKSEEQGAPDPCWLSENHCFVFEDHSDAKNTELSVAKAKQTMGHHNWAKEKLDLSEKTTISTILISPVNSANEGVSPHLKSFALWKIDEFRQWAENAFSVLRGLQASLNEVGDLSWRADAAVALDQAGLTATSLAQFVLDNRADKIMGYGS